MNERLLWLDLETTGLDPRKDVILEVFAVAADLETPQTLRATSVDAVLRGNGVAMDPYVLKMHKDSGLLPAVELAKHTTADVEQALWRYLEPDCVYYLAGNSVHFDLGFLRFHMPQVAAMLSHRCYDVSAALLHARSYGYAADKKPAAHRARADVLASIATAAEIANWWRAGAGA